MRSDGGQRRLPVGAVRGHVAWSVYRQRRDPAVPGDGHRRPGSARAAARGARRARPARSLFRVVLIHHPPLDALTKRRKALGRLRRVREVIARRGRRARAARPHPRGDGSVDARRGFRTCPSSATTSASANGSNEHELRARFNLFHIDGAANRWQIEMEVRALGDDGRFGLLERVPLERLAFARGADTDEPTRTERDDDQVRLPGDASWRSTPTGSSSSGRDR